MRTYTRRLPGVFAVAGLALLGACASQSEVKALRADVAQAQAEAAAANQRATAAEQRAAEAEAAARAAQESADRIYRQTLRK